MERQDPTRNSDIETGVTAWRRSNNFPTILLKASNRSSCCMRLPVHGAAGPAPGHTRRIALNASRRACWMDTCRPTKTKPAPLIQTKRPAPSWSVSTSPTSKPAHAVILSRISRPQQRSRPSTPRPLSRKPLRTDTTDPSGKSHGHQCGPRNRAPSPTPCRRSPPSAGTTSPPPAGRPEIAAPPCPSPRP